MTDADKPAFAQVHARLCVALGAKPDAAHLQVFFSALKDCEIEFVKIAAERLMLDAKWFPKTSEWRAAVRTVEAERVAAMRKLLLDSPSRLCTVCDDTAWARRADGRVYRCDCAKLRRLELLGRRPWPLLPAGEISDDDLSHAEAATMKKQIELRTGRIMEPRSMPKVPYGAEVRAGHENEGSDG